MLFVFGFDDLDEFAQGIIDMHLAHILTLDVDHGGGGVRIDGELALFSRVLLDAVVEGYMQRQVDDAVAAVDGVVPDVVGVSAGIFGREG